MKRKLLAPVAVVVLLAPAVTAPGLASLQQKGLLTPSAAPARVKGLLDQIQELFTKGDTQRPDVTTPPGARAGDSVIWGRITDTRGRPMQNATVRIEGDSMAGESIFLSPEPDEDGEYAIHDVPRGNYRVKAWADVNYRGHQWTLPLHPTDNSNAFVSPSVRKDFRWRLSGFMPRGMPDNFLSYYGCAISVRKGYSLNLPGDSIVIITLTPIGRLIDGSIGRPLTFERTPHALEIPGLRGENLDNTSRLYDIPIGPYRITAALQSGDGQLYQLPPVPYDVEFRPDSSKYEHGCGNASMFSLE